MERLLHYTWQNKLFPAGPHKTTHGIPLEIITPGVHNSDAGPDFIGSIVRINGMEFAGNVEIHTKSSDWNRHGHQDDRATETAGIIFASPSIDISNEVLAKLGYEK